MSDEHRKALERIVAMVDGDGVNAPDDVLAIGLIASRALSTSTAPAPTLDPGTLKLRDDQWLRGWLERFARDYVRRASDGAREDDIVAALDGIERHLLNPACHYIREGLDPGTIEACVRVLEALPVRGFATRPYSEALRAATDAIRSLVATPGTPTTCETCCGTKLVPDNETCDRISQLAQESGRDITVRPENFTKPCPDCATPGAKP